MRTKPLAVLAVTGGLMLALSGCATGGTPLTCVDGVVLLSASGGDAVFTDTCERFEIEGTDLDVDLERAQVSTIVIRGDRIDVDARDIDAVEINGQDNALDAANVGSLTIAGDRNEIDVVQELGAATINGNDNEIDARTLGAVTDNGSRNETKRDD